MKQDLSNKRIDYSKNKIDFTAIEENPLKMFNVWFGYAIESELISEAYAMTLSTIGQDGFPKSRVVLLKEFNADGFVFYTNYNSEKGQSILANPKVCLSFFWDKLEQQVIIKGIAEKVSEEMSDTYFAKRPKGSQIGAIVSNQSAEVPFDKDLEAMADELAQRYADEEISRPKHWGGFIVKPYEIEFWQGRPSRLHDRLSYRLEEGNWICKRLFP